MPLPEPQVSLNTREMKMQTPLCDVLLRCLNQLANAMIHSSCPCIILQSLVYSRACPAPLSQAVGMPTNPLFFQGCDELIDLCR